MFIAIAVPDHYDEIQNTLTTSLGKSANPSVGGEKSSVGSSNCRNMTRDEKSPDRVNALN